MSTNPSSQNGIHRLRKARARGQIRLKTGSLGEYSEDMLAEGGFLEAARTAGVLAAKQAPQLIPSVVEDPVREIKLEIQHREEPPGFEIQAEVATFTNQGGEMAALTAVTTAALTVYDKLRSRERSLEITGIQLLESPRDSRHTFRKV